MHCLPHAWELGGIFLMGPGRDLLRDCSQGRRGTPGSPPCPHPSLCAQVRGRLQCLQPFLGWTRACVASLGDTCESGSGKTSLVALGTMHRCGPSPGGPVGLDPAMVSLEGWFQPWWLDIVLS